MRPLVALGVTEVPLMAGDFQTADLASDVMYICLPKSTIEAIMAGSDPIYPNSCHLCPQVDSNRYNTVGEIINHYLSDQHKYKVELVDQESVLTMHQYMYCHLCDHDAFLSFHELNQHMKTDHNM